MRLVAKPKRITVTLVMQETFFKFTLKQHVFRLVLLVGLTPQLTTVQSVILLVQLALSRLTFV